jgi:hypothetical protein
MNSMFGYARTFNHDLSKWNVTAMTDMSNMFYQASAFNQELCWSLNEGAVTTGMFYGSGGGSFASP